MEDPIYGFSAGVADQLLRIIGQTPIVDAANSHNNYTTIAVAYTTAGATGRSGTTLGTGTATLYYFAVSGADRVLTTQTVDVTFHNMSSGTVAATKFLMLLLVGDVWICNWEEC